MRWIKYAVPLYNTYIYKKPQMFCKLGKCTAELCLSRQSRGDLYTGKTQKQETQGPACCISTLLSVNGNLGLTTRKLEFKELQ